MGNEQGIPADYDGIFPPGLPIGAAGADGVSRKRRISPEFGSSTDDHARKWTRKPGGRKGATPAKKGGSSAANGGSTADDGSSEDPIAPIQSANAQETGSGRKRVPVDAKFLEWAPHEDELIREGVQAHGFKWTLIALELPGRTDNAVRNRWKRLEEGEQWRQSMVGEGVDVHALPPDLVPGYKCRKCGQPKRGHTCPFNAPPLVGSFEPAPVARSTSGSLLRHDASAQAARAHLEQLHRLLGDGPIDAPLPAQLALPAAAAPPQAVAARRIAAAGAGAGAGAGAAAAADGGALPSPPADLSRNSSSIEKLLGLSRDFSFSWLRSLQGQTSNGSGAYAQTAAAAAAAFAPPPARAPSLGGGGGGLERESDSLALVRRELQALADSGGHGADLQPPQLVRTASSVERLYSFGKEFSISFLADALGISPGKRRSSSMSNGPYADGGDHAGFTPRR